MRLRCCATYCDQKIRPGVPFFRFPPETDAIRWHIWQKRLLLNPSDKPAKLLVCYQHFSPAQFVCAIKDKKLAKNAVPDRNVILDESYMNQACRFCLETGGTQVVSLYASTSSDRTVLAQEVNGILGIEVSPNDGLPQHVCLTCTTKLKYLKRIREQFQASDTKLRVIASGVPHVLKSEKDSLIDAIPVDVPNGHSKELAPQHAVISSNPSLADSNDYTSPASHSVYEYSTSENRTGSDVADFLNIRIKPEPLDSSSGSDLNTAFLSGPETNPSGEQQQFSCATGKENESEMVPAPAMNTSVTLSPGSEILTADQILIEGDDQIIETNVSFREESGVEHQLLFTSECILPLGTDKITVVETKCFGLFDDDEVQSDEDEAIYDKLAYYARPFRYPKRKRFEELQY